MLIPHQELHATVRDNRLVENFVTGCRKANGCNKLLHLTDPNFVKCPCFSLGSALIIFSNTNATLLLVERWHLLRTDGS